MAFLDNYQQPRCHAVEDFIQLREVVEVSLELLVLYPDPLGVVNENRNRHLQEVASFGITWPHISVSTSQLLITSVV